MSKNSDLQKRRDASIARGISNQLPVFVERARNAEIWDVEGRRYVDFASGIAVVNTGHVHPRVQAAVAAQLEAFTHTCFMVTPYAVAVELAERLNKLAPGPTAKKSIFVTTGAEAVENAIKIARAHTGRSGVIAFGGGFHGRTFMAMALTGKVAPYKAGFGPFPAEIYHAPFPIAYHGVSTRDSLEALEHLFKYDIEPTRVAAIIVEPVLGEGGFYIAPPEFLQALRKLCDQHGIVLVIDEIQTGFARTGRMFAIEYAGIEPDIMTMAKSLAGGFPLAAVVGKAAIMDAAAPGGLGGTYAGSPIACAAALAVLDVFEEENVQQRVLENGTVLRAGLEELTRESPYVAEVRGRGLYVAVEIVQDRETLQPDRGRAEDVISDMRDRRVLISGSGPAANVLKIRPPLAFSSADVTRFLETFAEVAKERL